MRDDVQLLLIPKEARAFTFADVVWFLSGFVLKLVSSFPVRVSATGSCFVVVSVCAFHNTRADVFQGHYLFVVSASVRAHFVLRKHRSTFNVADVSEGKEAKGRPCAAWLRY